MLEFKASTIARLPVLLLQSDGTPLTGVVYTDASITVEKSDGTTATYVPSNVEWVELVAGDFSGQGKYTLVLPASYLNLTGVLSYAVSAPTAKTYLGVVKVIANEEAETKAVADALRTDYTTTRAGKIDTIDTQTATTDGKVDTLIADMGTLSTKMDDVVDYHQGKWEIKTTGPDANRLILYRADGVTVLKKFDLADAAGNPTYISPFKRTPV